MLIFGYDRENAWMSKSTFSDFSFQLSGFFLLNFKPACFDKLSTSTVTAH